MLHMPHEHYTVYDILLSIVLRTKCESIEKPSFLFSLFYKLVFEEKEHEK